MMHGHCVYAILARNTVEVTLKVVFIYPFMVIELEI